MHFQIIDNVRQTREEQLADATSSLYQTKEGQVSLQFFGSGHDTMAPHLPAGGKKEVFRQERMLCSI